MVAVEKALKAAGDRIGRTWDPKEWEEDPRFVAVIETMGRGLKRDAMRQLQALFQAAPNHLYGRKLLFDLAIEMKDIDAISAHAEWALSYHAQHGSPESAVAVYRCTRTVAPNFAWSEKALLTIQRIGEKAKDNPVVVDAARMLLAQFPDSQALPRVLFASAEAQLREGRAGLARATLKSLLDTFPLDPLVPHAERKLVEVERQLQEMRRRVEQEERAQQMLLERKQRIERQVRLTEQRELERKQRLEQQRQLEEREHLERQLERQRQEQLESERLLAASHQLQRATLADMQPPPDPLVEMVHTPTLEELPSLAAQPLVEPPPLRAVPPPVLEDPASLAPQPLAEPPRPPPALDEPGAAEPQQLTSESQAALVQQLKIVVLAAPQECGDTATRREFAEKPPSPPRTRTLVPRYEISPISQSALA